eukprot:TRINITY_DN1896_c0_g1_i2.p3 TRINITY_DN1896_c0_g1~~TRINITY_DN1896_c0_g1_i2.p3  ORF type:complete len:147 (-),score=44.37 TRINITY_DN1896_c0_g1_i2:59-499(-)
MKKNFFKYHSQLFRHALPPPWAEDNYFRKCELYQWSKIIEANIEMDQELSHLFSNAPAPKIHDPELFPHLIEVVFKHLQKEYNKDKQELIPQLTKEKAYLLLRSGLSRDEKRELELKRKEKLLARIEEVQKKLNPSEEHILSLIHI